MAKTVAVRGDSVASLCDVGERLHDLAPRLRELVALLRELASSGLAVIHVTHRAEEAAVADEVLEMTVRRDAADARQPPATAPMLALSPKPTPRSRRTLFTRPGAMPPAGASSAQLAGAASDMALPPATLPAQPPATPTLPGAGARRGTDPASRVLRFS